MIRPTLPDTPNYTTLRGTIGFLPSALIQINAPANGC